VIFVVLIVVTFYCYCFAYLRWIDDDTIENLLVFLRQKGFVTVYYSLSLFINEINCSLQYFCLYPKVLYPRR